MLLIHCPYCGPRAELEFRYGGEAHVMREPGTADDQAWSEFLYTRTNPRGAHAERWRHLNGCARFFNVVRNTATDHILATYKTGEPCPDLAELMKGDVK